jgi:hypothetical protein
MGGSQELRLGPTWCFLVRFLGPGRGDMPTCRRRARRSAFGRPPLDFTMPGGSGAGSDRSGRYSSYFPRGASGGGACPRGPVASAHRGLPATGAGSTPKDRGSGVVQERGRTALAHRSFQSSHHEQQCTDLPDASKTIPGAISPACVVCHLCYPYTGRRRRGGEPRFPMARSFSDHSSDRECQRGGSHVSVLRSPI